MRQAAFSLLLASLALLPGAVHAQASDEDALLNVTISVFDPGVPADDSVLRDLEVFPRIRGVEAQLLPFRLREALVLSGEWGAVRVVTKPDLAAELLLTGSILRSDGDVLALRMRAEDATGAVWFDRAFSAEAVDDTSPGTEFFHLYAGIAEALLESRDLLDQAAIRSVQNTSLMRYAVELAPASFGEFIEETPDGKWELLRLPASNDPMLERIQLIRNTEFLITDTIDSKFRELNDDVARTYRVWRDYRRKYVSYEEENYRFAQRNYRDAPRGSWEAIKDQYDIYKYDRVTVQEQDRLAVAFDNEVRPLVRAMEERVAELEGWVEDGYREWRRLLDELEEVETYLGE